MKTQKTLISTLALMLLLTLGVGLTQAQGPKPDRGTVPQVAASSGFTYQGRLTDDSSPANGTYDLRFILYDALIGGSQIGSIVSKENVAVADGFFTVELDFGAGAFIGDARYLEIGVRRGSDTGNYTILSPRQPLAAVPYALYALNTGTSGGVDVGSVAGDGVHIIAAGDDGVHVESTGAHGVRLDSVGHTGVYIVSAERDGMYVDWAGDDGVHIDWAEDNAIQVDGADGNGIHVSDADGHAGYFDGSVHVTGHLSKGGGGFKIDHPLDPEDKYLHHSFVESPDMMNVYNDNVTLDDDGEAWVELPAWFQALNQDFRYQLTAIGAPGPNLYIAQEVSDNRFRIAGGEPAMTVSWQVTGIRHDPYAQANRVPVEETKAPEESGTYLHPEAYGLRRATGMADTQAQQLDPLGLGR
jgi:hypothetical protein